MIGVEKGHQNQDYNGTLLSWPAAICDPFRIYKHTQAVVYRETGEAVRQYLELISYVVYVFWVAQVSRKRQSCNQVLNWSIIKRFTISWKSLINLLEVKSWSLFRPTSPVYMFFCDKPLSWQQIKVPPPLSQQLWIVIYVHDSASSCDVGLVLAIAWPQERRCYRFGSYVRF